VIYGRRPHRLDPNLVLEVVLIRVAGDPVNQPALVGMIAGRIRASQARFSQAGHALDGGYMYLAKFLQHFRQRPRLVPVVKDRVDLVFTCVGVRDCLHLQTLVCRPSADDGQQFVVPCRQVSQVILHRPPVGLGGDQYKFEGYRVMISLDAFEASLTLQTERLCLDFTNTLNWHASPRPVEELPTFADLVSWAQRVGLLSEADAQRLRRLAARHPALARAVLARAHALREAIYCLLSDMAHGRPAPSADLDLVNAELAGAMAHARLAPASGGFGLHLSIEPLALDRMLWPVAYSAASLLATPDLLARVGECADDRGCGWLYLDMIKNRSRRWCDMKDCGNRAKARRHYERQRAII
jgi:predicted RNA-binding Zn ribbon-like protein